MFVCCCLPVLVCLPVCGFVSGNRARTPARASASRTRASRSGDTAPYTCAVSPTFLYGAFFFVASALADVPSARLTLSAYPPERSGVAEGELNAGRKSAAALSDLDTTDAIRPQSDPAISPRQIRRVEPTRHDYHSKLPQVRQAKLGRTNSGRSYIVKKSTYD